MGEGGLHDIECGDNPKIYSEGGRPPDGSSQIPLIRHPLVHHHKQPHCRGLL